jgi:hypothetical protein
MSIDSMCISNVYVNIDTTVNMPSDITDCNIDTTVNMLSDITIDVTRPSDITDF